jgi:hypothetical protein
VELHKENTTIQRMTWNYTKKIQPFKGWRGITHRKYNTSTEYMAIHIENTTHQRIIWNYIKKIQLFNELHGVTHSKYNPS